MKLVLAIVQDKDADTLAKEFIQNDVRATKLATSGGFLRAGNTTFIVGIEDDRVNEVLEIIKICEENSIAYNLYTEKVILTTNLKFNVLYYYKENLKKEENKQTNISIVENMYEYVENMENNKFLKITICDENDKIFHSIIKKLKEINGIEVLDVEHMSRKIIKQGTEEIPVEYFYSEISASNVDKWNAIEFLLQKMELKKEEVMAIGDNINDKKMIEEAGMGVAMRGSTPEIIKVAKEVTDTNDNDGVAMVLEKYLL